MTGFSAARAFALAVLVAVLAGSSGTAHAQQSGDSHRGILTVVWGDPHRSAAASSEIEFGIVYPDGTRVPLSVGPELRNVAIQHAGKRVTVRGNASAESGRARIKVESIDAPEAGPRTEAAPGTEAVVTRRVLYILLKFTGDNQEPHTPAFFRNMTNPMTPSGNIPATINGFFGKVSYGALQWSGTVAGNRWYTLPKTRAQYAPGCGSTSGCFVSSLDALGDDALALVAGDVNVNAFDNINFVFNNDLDCCAWGGTYSNGLRSWGATWEPPWGQEPGVYVHELGHSLGLPHSGWRYYAYDSQHDQMSDGAAASTMNCGNYNSALFGGPNTPLWCEKPGGGFIAAHQDHLGWIPAANKRTHSTVSSKVYTIEANSAPLGTRLKLVRVCLQGRPCSGADGSNARFITIEAKLRGADFDNGIPSQGVVIHDVLMNRGNSIGGSCYFNSQNGWAVPFDAGGNDWNASTCSGEGLADMAYGVNKTFTNNTLGVKVEVLSKTGNTFRVRVTKTK